MGYSSWSTDAWKTYATTTRAKPVEEIFKSRSIDKDLNPFGIAIRESRDSDAHPNSTPLIVACDVTGSMGKLAETLVKRGIGTLFEEILSRKPITDPHLMVMGIGDALYDTAPLQVSQFETDLKIATWLERIYLEGGGGGNNHESYDLPYYFAANHTAIDSFEKRNKKGYIFTMGDELPPKRLDGSQVRKFIGDSVESEPFSDVIFQCSKIYHCFHLMVAQGNYASYNPDRVKSEWTELLGQRAIWLTDIADLSEVIISLIQVTEGESADAVVKSWGGSTALTVNDALKGYSIAEKPLTGFVRIK